MSPIKAPSDSELLRRARHGDEAAFTELYVRHKAVARRVAATYRRTDTEDLVNEAFEKVLGALRRGGGPTDAFRAYLLVTLRRLAVERNGNGHGIAEEPLDELPEPVVASVDAPELSSEDRALITRAFESLPDRWQAVLWYTAVEGRHPREITNHLGLSANAVSALAYRAREQLRQNYLQAHLRTAPAARCKPHREGLSAYVRGTLSRRDGATTQQHLDRCSECRSLVDELSDVNRLLVRSVLPLFLLQPERKLASVLTSAAETAGHLGDASLQARRALWVVGGVAATATALLGLGGAKNLVWREEAPPNIRTVQSADGERSTTTASTAPPTTAPSSSRASTTTTIEASTTAPPETIGEVVVTAPPVDLTVTIDLPEGVDLHLGELLPTDCTVKLDLSQITCEVDQPLTETSIEAELGVELAELLRGHVAEVTVRQGDVVLDVNTEDLLPSLTDTVSGLLGQ